MPTSAAFTDSNNALLKDRLARISAELRGLVLSTADEYQAQVYSKVNSVLTLGMAMTPLKPVSGQGPAIVGDVSDNYTILNNDSQDIANELLRIEDAAASLFNLSATSQNQLRQQIREFIYLLNPNLWDEEFLNANQLSAYTASLDYNAGLATLPVLDESVAVPTYMAGTNSVGSLDPSSSFDYLSDGRTDTALIWNGTSLELIFTFSTPTIINRLEMSLDNYDGMEIDSFITSPDGNTVQDVLVDLGVQSIELDGTSSKFSGDVIIDFPPRHVKLAKIVINDLVGAELIAIRGITISARRYSDTAQLTSDAISQPSGSVLFSTTQTVFDPYVSITHQISYDNTSFSAINPGQTITLSSSPFYYRAILERNVSAFSNSQGPLVQSPLDPVASPYYTLTNTTSVPLGTGIIQRTLQLSDVSGPIVLRETPLPNTLVIQEGAVVLSIANGDYTFTDNTIVINGGGTGIVVSYQTSSLGTAAVADLKEYYTPLLYGYKFENQ